jgi:hypothetical protein
MVDLSLRTWVLGCALVFAGCPADVAAPAASTAPAAATAPPASAPTTAVAAPTNPEHPPCPAGLAGVTSELTPDPSGAILRLTAADDATHAALDAATRAVLSLDPAARRAAVLADATRAEHGETSPTSLASCPLLVGELDARRVESATPRTALVELRARRPEALQPALREVVERLANLARQATP